MQTITGNIPFVEPPEWAVLERSLIDLMNGAVYPVMEKYVRADGSVLWPTAEDFSSIDGLDDAYESFFNWPLFYLLGGGDHILALSHKTYDGITAQFGRIDSGYGHPMVVKEYEQGYDWMHQGEGYVFFYSLCMADPRSEKNRKRARSYAGFYLNEDPEAINYDPDKKILLCPHLGSKGPAYRNFEAKPRHYPYSFWKVYPLPFLDIEGIDTVEDLQKPGMEQKMARAMTERMARGDVSVNLASTSLVTNATSSAATTNKNTKTGSSSTSAPGSSAPGKTTASCPTTSATPAGSANGWADAGTAVITAGAGPTAGAPSATRSPALPKTP